MWQHKMSSALCGLLLSCAAAAPAVSPPPQVATAAVWKDRGDCPDQRQCAVWGLCWLDDPANPAARQRVITGKDLCSAKSDEDCQISRICRDSGHCFSMRNGGFCLATPPDQNCAASPACRAGGRCEWNFGSCQPSKDAHCAQSTESCGVFGGCAYLGNHQCGPKTAEHCTSSSGCQLDGQCTVQGDLCVLGSVDDCLNHGACQLRGHCTVHKWRNGPGSNCVAQSAAVCAAAPFCKQRGMCTFQPYLGAMACLPGNTADCSNSDLCKLKGLCRFHPHWLECVK